MDKPTDLNKLIQNAIKDPSLTKQEVLMLVKKRCRPVHLSPQTLGMLFEIIAGVEYDPDDDTTCFSNEILVSDLVRVHPDFKSTNGCQWARSDSSYLGKRYIIKRKLERGRVVSIQLDGPNHNSVKKYRNIRKDIVEAISSKRCVILDTASRIEVDHKNGRYDELSNTDPKTQKLEDFQPLTRTANIAKRQHCKECRESKKRYDARRLGYKDGWFVGDEDTPNCIGCYWYDPVTFNKHISKDFSR